MYFFVKQNIRIVFQIAEAAYSMIVTPVL